MPKTEVQTLSEVIESTRTLTRFYISKLKDFDMKKEFEVNGQTINSAYWIVGHLVWSEQFILLKALGGPVEEIHWLSHFGLGTMLEDHADMPSVKEMLDKWKEVHQTAMDFLKTLQDEELKENNALDIGFDGDNSKRMMIHHVIRHEAIHAGHLGLICKIFGVKIL